MDEQQHGSTVARVIVYGIGIYLAIGTLLGEVVAFLSMPFLDYVVMGQFVTLLWALFWPFLICAGLAG